MKFYFAGIDPQLFNLIRERHIPVKPMKILVSMAAMTPTLHAQLCYGRETGLISELALDSGTFSLNKPDAKLDARHLYYRFGEYAAAHPRMYKLIFTFDRWFSPDEFEANYKYVHQLEKVGIPVVPVAHDVIHQDYNLLADSGHDSVAFGQDKNRNVGTLLRANYELIQQGVNVRHGLGIMDPKTLMFIPFTSVDASTATQEGVKYKVHYIDATKPKCQQWRVISVKDATGKVTSDEFNAKKKSLLKWLKSIDANISWEDLTEKKGRVFRTIVNILFYQAIEPEIEANNKLVTHYLKTGEVANLDNVDGFIY